MKSFLDRYLSGEDFGLSESTDKIDELLEQNNNPIVCEPTPEIKVSAIREAIADEFKEFHQSKEFHKAVATTREKPEVVKLPKSNAFDKHIDKIFKERGIDIMIIVDVS